MTDARQSAAFELLDPGIQRWIWKQGWRELRQIQEDAVRPILEGKQDVILSASTASGKTEAVFFPVLTRLAQQEKKSLCICVSPLKALINDQYDRLQSMGEAAGVEVVRWHGDVRQAEKKKFLESPEGVLLITPESLEAQLVRRGSQAQKIWGGLIHVVVDELHTFIGTERGKQLQSLLHRLELLNRRFIPRIALSATLDDPSVGAEYLRSNSSHIPVLLEQKLGREIRLIQKGYRRLQAGCSRDKATTSSQEEYAEEGVQTEENQQERSVLQEICSHLYSQLRGSHNLVFANSRARVEEVADLLRRRCETDRVPNEFLPHHGSLSRDLREHAELRLKKRAIPASLIATTTLEMGIDVGAVKSIAQIGLPPSVASLVQRMGRSGREEGEPAILRVYIQEEECRAEMDLQDALRVQTVQAIAMVQLMLERWLEKPHVSSLHLSTLIQQILSLVAQYGGVRASDAWSVFCQQGPFSLPNRSTFVLLLRSLGHHDLLTQTNDGLLVLGERGERLVDHYDFYSAFFSPEEFQVVHEGQTVGFLPVSQPVTPESYLILGGRRWVVQNVELDTKVITVRPSRGGRPPRFEGGGELVHDVVRWRMREIYLSEEEPPFADKITRELLQEGRAAFHRYGLSKRDLVQTQKACLFYPWCGDRALVTLELLFSGQGLSVSKEGVHLRIEGSSAEELAEVVSALLHRGLPSDIELASRVENKWLGKYDKFLPEELLNLNYASQMLDRDAAERVLRRFLPNLSAYSKAHLS